MKGIFMNCVKSFEVINSLVLCETRNGTSTQLNILEFIDHLHFNILSHTHISETHTYTREHSAKASQR